MSLLFALAFGFGGALVYITNLALNPTNGFVLPWVINQVDELGRPAKGRLDVSNYIKNRRN